MDPFVAMQVGAVSFVDEGVGTVLDVLAERGGVNALFLATPTWTRGTGGRQVPGYPLPDHGVQEYDLDWRGGNYASVHPAHYGNTALGAVGRAPEHPDLDLFEAVLPEAKRRGMLSYAWMEESGSARELRTYPNFPKVLEVDAWGRPGTRPCFNNPDYRNWHLGFVEDYATNFELDGLAWCSERPGPLNLLMQGPVRVGDVGCFCPHCQSFGRGRGIDVRRAREGYRELVEWNRKVGSGNREDRPADGAFVTFWRILLRYPEVLAWQTLWTQSQRNLYRDIYGVAKACRPEIQVGWHVYHNISFSPFYRADQDYDEMAEFSDYIKVVIYNNCAGPRFYTWVQNICRGLLADAEPEDVYPLLMRLLQLTETDYEKLPQSGFSAEYVRRETARAVAGVKGRSAIYPGIDIDIPVGQPAREFQRPGVAKANWDSTEGELTQCSPESVRDAVLAAFEGGAEGVVLSRKYSEMRLDNLSGAGAALERLGR